MRPALASFLVGLFVLGGAVPQVVSWAALQYMRQAGGGSVLDGALPLLDQQSVATGAEIIARVVVGAALLALSRRPDFWPIPDAAAPAVGGDPPADDQAPANG